MPSKLGHHAEQLGALGHPVRLAILRFAVQAGVEGAAAGAIQGHVDLPASTLSHHLKRLADADRSVVFLQYADEQRIVRKEQWTEHKERIHDAPERS